MQKLLVSVRGKVEALEATKGGAHIADVEFPASALGTPYPLNIFTVRKSLPKFVQVSTNIGEEQLVRSTACQAAIGVAVAGADIIKAGLAKMKYDEASYLAKSLVRTVHTFCSNKKIILAVFVDSNMVRKYLDPISEGIKLVKSTNADGILIDTYDKAKGKGLLDYLGTKEIRDFVRYCHRTSSDAWIAGSITRDQLPGLWETGVDVICARAAACESSKGKGRFGQVKAEIVRQLVATMKDARRR